MPQSIFFDRNDTILLRIVSDVLDRTELGARTLLAPAMHPHGIKEMAAPRVLRIAYAIASLLGTLEGGQAVDRLSALRSLRDEILLSAPSCFQKNTSRVLLQIMKELVRQRGDTEAGLRLAHDFRMASSGIPRVVRAELQKYHLLEMPEEWNQLAFDDHVHDANTKGRKSPTHLVMDAWIKGVRFLTVVYYNYVDEDVAEELLEAGRILNMHIRVGIEVSSRFRGKYVRIVWEPHGYTDAKAFRAFLNEHPVREFMDQGRRISAYQQRYVLDVLAAYNNRHRLAINVEYGLDLELLDAAGFARFVGTGQPSLLHLAKYIQSGMQAKLRQAAQSITAEYQAATPARQAILTERLARLNAIDSELLINHYLQPAHNPELNDPGIPQDGPDVPQQLHLQPAELLPRLARFHSNSRFILNLSNLSVPDTLEILYTCQGLINTIEIYNLKDVSRGKWSMPPSSRLACPGDAVDLISPEQTYAQISGLQKALNEDNVIALKRAIREIISAFEHDRQTLINAIHMAQAKNISANALLLDELAGMDERARTLQDILFNIESFHKYYKQNPLDSRIGSGSTGQSRHQYGMGMVVLQTLPPRAQKIALDRSSGQRKLLPITANMSIHLHGPGPGNTTCSLVQRAAGFLSPECATTKQWLLENILVHPGRMGNVLTLGGVQTGHDNGLRLAHDHTSVTTRPGFKYLNTGVKNALKIGVGFIPAFLTFFLTKDWWVLAYLGGLIWFGITGVRNVLQAVLGGGGLRRSPLVQWNSLVSWSRVADDLFFTGFSVPLLDLVVKTWILDQTLGITTATNPVALFATMALANGVYLSSHNTWRGLPRSVIVANFFRTILSIPLAIAFNMGLTSSMHLAGISGVETALQKWAAVISKLASDCVAAIIEGLGDRHTNIRLRLSDYRTKLTGMFNAFAHLDMLFPEEDVLDMLQSPKMFMETMSYEARDLERVLIVNALDLMYFWFYQPRAPRAVAMIMAGMSQEEWLIFLRSQYVLKRYREISQMFVDGLVGKKFSRALSFYLEHFDAYLQSMETLGERHGLSQRRASLNTGTLT